ncbi:MAG: NrdH-redoxin [Dehalococcoidia bacterium]|nr:NrdH-redoxin [Dehalococcoidia bacterium]
MNKSNKENNKALMYSHPTCGYCDLMREELVEKSINFEEIDVSKNPEMWKEVEKLSGGDRITPVLVSPNGDVEIGFRGIGCNYNS